jgi:hypothetical protein
MVKKTNKDKNPLLGTQVSGPVVSHPARYSLLHGNHVPDNDVDTVTPCRPDRLLDHALHR